MFFGYLVNQIGFRVRQATADALRPFGITPPLLRLMGIIAVDQPLTQVQLAVRSAVDRTSITKFVDRLEALGFAERRRDRADRRSHAIVLTAVGADALAAGVTAAARVETDVLGSLDEAERDILIRLLARVNGTHANMCPDPEQEDNRP